MKWLKLIFWSLLILPLSVAGARASEADLAIPDLHAGTFNIFGHEISAWWLLFWGALVITGTLSISLYLRAQIRKLPAHSSMLNVAETIFQTCKTYLIQQGKFLLMLFVLIAIAISYYLLGFGHATEYELTNRVIQELRIEKVPEATLAKLKPLEQQPISISGKTIEELEQKNLPEKELKGLKELREKELKNNEARRSKDKAEFLGKLKAAVGEDWSKPREGSTETIGNTIGRLAAPEGISPILMVLMVLLFAVVGMGGSFWVAWYGIRVNTY